MATWQKVLALLGAGVMIAVVILLASGDHGPSRHVPGGDTGQQVDDEGGSMHDPSRWNH